MIHGEIRNQRDVLAHRAAYLISMGGQPAGPLVSTPGHAVSEWIVEQGRKNPVSISRNQAISKELCNFRRMEADYARALISYVSGLVACGKMTLKEPRHLTAGESSEEYDVSIILDTSGRVVQSFQPQRQGSGAREFSTIYEPHPFAAFYQTRGMTLVSDVIQGLERIVGI